MKRTLTLLLVIAIAFFVLGSDARARMLFMDRFEYAVGRSDANAVELFRQGGGWANGKSQQSSSGAHGYLYTVTSIPGYSGPFPGMNSTRVLAIEALPGTLNGQSDFYLQFGTSTPNEIPGDVWIQFWVYPQYYGSQLSRFGSKNKFLYVTNDVYPSHTHKWMMNAQCLAYAPNGGEPRGNPANGEFFLTLDSAAGVSSIVYTPGDPVQKLGQQNITEWMKPNRWTLVKMHFDTTHTTGNSWEMWLRPYRGSWIKVSEWIGGRTPNFTWDIPAASVGGHVALRMPTTAGDVSSQLYDYWMYMDDFAIATAEQDLPSYSDVRSPLAPTNLRIIGGAPANALLDADLLRRLFPLPKVPGERAH